MSPKRLGVACEAVSGFAREARSLGVERLEVLVASPGRQAANATQVLSVLERAAGAPVRVLRRGEEARFAFDGALAKARRLRPAVAVCDVGGGSTQLGVGGEPFGASWLRSFDIGSLRLTAQAIRADPPGKRAIAEARRLARVELDGVVTPMPRTALAVGGSARALQRIVGPELGRDELAEAVRILRKQPAAVVAEAYRIAPERARTLAAGAVILAEAQRRLHVPLRVVEGGLREGAALALAARATAA